MNGSAWRQFRGPGIAVLAGLATVAFDLAGQVAASPFLSVLELVCGLTAGLGFAALWMRSGYSRLEKALFILLLAIHIFAVWPWLPFAVGLAVREKDRPAPDRRWFGRACAVLALTAAALGGTGMICRGLFPPGMPLPAWVVPAGGAVLVLVPWFAARYGLALSRREAAGVVCCAAATAALMLTAALLVRLRVWRPEPWPVYVATTAVLAGAGYGAYRLRLPDGVRGLVLAPLGGMAVLLAGWIALDGYLDAKYYYPRRRQQAILRRNVADAMPLAEACRVYRARFGAWPDAPEKLTPFLPPKTRMRNMTATGCHIEKNGDFLLLLQRGSKPPVFARRFRADGTGSWEIFASNHPALPPGAKRRKHPFPYTD